MNGPAEELEHEAREALAGALAPSAGAGPTAAREPPRFRLERAIALAERAVLAAREEQLQACRAPRSAAIAEVMARARLTLVRALAARAEDARHGAGQLSLSAQRAPTLDACDSGWRRAAAVSSEAERFAARAEAIARELEDAAPGTALARRAQAAARRAARAAREARALIAQRNLAFTFHVDEAFSFGEGWHVAAAAVLAGVAVQVEPGKPATAQAERFLREAGLGGQLAPYRARPRAMKQATEIVACAFRRDPAAAQHALRLAFLGDDPVPPAVASWADRRLAAAAGAPGDRPRVALWIRRGSHQPDRNTAAEELRLLLGCAEEAALAPVLIGEAVPAGCDPGGAADLTLHRQDPAFRGTDARRAQLQLFEHLRRAHRLVGQVGVTTAGMDGPALLGLPTVYLTDRPNPRLRQWEGVVPGYEEVVREGAYLARVAARLQRWAVTGGGGSHAD